MENELKQIIKFALFNTDAPFSRTARVSTASRIASTAWYSTDMFDFTNRRLNMVVCLFIRRGQVKTMTKIETVHTAA